MYLSKTRIKGDLISTLETVDEWAVPTDPMEASRQRVKLQRELKDLKRETEEVKSKVALLDKVIQDAMIEGAFPDSSRVDGAAVFLEQTIWASARDHEHLVPVLDKLGLDHLKPRTVNSQALSGYVREHIHPDKTLDIMERLELGHPENGRLPQELLVHLKVSAVEKVKVTGA